MRLNLGCGPDVKEGYVNVDFFDGHADEKVDLSKFPWPWKSDSADEILMLDFLEHFPYRMTDVILRECWRILKMDGEVVIQVPDFEHCARAAINCGPFQCNKCGHLFKDADRRKWEVCAGCGQSAFDIADAAVKRLYGGQDREGNWHHFAFTNQSLHVHLTSNDFEHVKYEEEKHQHDNWNFKVRAKKVVVW